jgi:CHASE1-domain containing sensor protein
LPVGLISRFGCDVPPSGGASRRLPKSAWPHAHLGGHSPTTLPMTAAIFALSIACAATMIFIVPRRTVVVSEELIEKAEQEE